MRTSARLVVASFISALALVVLPIAAADASQVRPQVVHCCI
jgi:hypothetical protein